MPVGGFLARYEEIAFGNPRIENELSGIFYDPVLVGAARRELEFGDLSNDTPLPAELEGFRHDTWLEKSSHRSLRAKHLAVLAFVASCIGLAFYLEPWPLRIAAVGIGVVVFCGYFGRSSKKPKALCPECGKEMSVVQTAFPKDQLDDSDGFGLSHRKNWRLLHTSFQGADGHIYLISRPTSGSLDEPGGCSYSFARLLQRWCACEDCRICFCAEPKGIHHLRFLQNEAEVDLQQERLTGEHFEKMEFLDRLEGGTGEKTSFLKELGKNDRNSESP